MRQRGRGTDAFFNCFLVVVLGVAGGVAGAGRFVAIATTTRSTSRDRRAVGKLTGKR